MFHEREVNPVRKSGALNPTLPACRQAGIRNGHFPLYLHHQWWGFLRGKDNKSGGTY